MFNLINHSIEDRRQHKEFANVGKGGPETQHESRTIITLFYQAAGYGLMIFYPALEDFIPIWEPFSKCTAPPIFFRCPRPFYGKFSNSTRLYNRLVVHYLALILVNLLSINEQYNRVVFENSLYLESSKNVCINKSI